jgi:hypothetical protein
MRAALVITLLVAAAILIISDQIGEFFYPFPPGPPVLAGRLPDE